jgi:hypothetical protein
MNLDLKYIVDAIKALNAANVALMEGTPEQRGSARADCILAAIALEVRIGRVVVDVNGVGVHQPAESLQ